MTKLIAVVGASGSGKSSVVARLTAGREGRISVVHADSYYRDLSHLTFEERDRVNYDHPDAIEFERLCKDLRSLKAGQRIEAPVYDFSVHNRAAETQGIDATDVVIVEGILVLADPITVELIDKIVFIETSLATCLKRRIERDRTERGRSERSVRDFWETRAAPMFLQYVAPWRDRADLVLSGERDLSAAHEQLSAWLLADTSQ
ncbi:uridine kinase [Candidatus Paraluminiphilus aquimaris]|uniref:uridine/cytidine kinase n=1 Tax=Candidatus Paraluminiphilus aquimaris TaxID=2518994 RepID=A0ABY6Q810_9GAMM|nr:uridine kinase [Candidatus Paraluminiphilus aquimaris]UZP75038.1 uridine kinase [Candidatus Paraluminiphilus aquimaris]